MTNQTVKRIIARSQNIPSIFEIGAAAAKAHKEALATLNECLATQPVSVLLDLIAACKIAKPYYFDLNAYMKAKGVVVRVANWHMKTREGENFKRCEHKAYNVGTTQKAQIGQIGDESWTEAWIA